MRAHYFQHVPFEGLGAIEGWLDRAGYAVGCTRFHDSDALPDPEGVDLLIIMGGPMGVNDEGELPWLVEEKRFVRAFIRSGRPVLGICLGAQLMASAMGSKVFPNEHKEIGWFPVRGVEAEGGGTFAFPAATDVFHWHGETFSLPEGAVRIAESDACANQAFQLGRNAIGLQFHLETTAATARTLVEHCSDELVEGRYIQSEADILSAPQERYDAIHGLMHEVLMYLHGQAG